MSSVFHNSFHETSSVFYDWCRIAERMLKDGVLFLKSEGTRGRYVRDFEEIFFHFSVNKPRDFVFAVEDGKGEFESTGVSIRVS